MFIVTNNSNNLQSDTASFIEALKRLPAELRDFFEAGREIVVTRAPGRLDLMGGIADYSGSLVLQWPIAAASHVALQKRTDRLVRVVSLPRIFEISLDEFISDAGPVEYEAARKKFSLREKNHWAAYAAGSFPVLEREAGAGFDVGANILIRSKVPEGKGVSSSAALEVSVMQAVNVAYRLGIEAREMAFLCQKVENLIAGAPCGVMDQMTSACGEEGRLLELLCQPGELLGSVKLPDDLAVWGIDSGIRHAVTGSDYGTVRTAAFMGYRIIAEIAGMPCMPAGRRGHVLIEDTRLNGYLANLNPVEFEERYAALLPEEITGADFLDKYQGIHDTVTSVDGDRTYPVFRATRHPVFENARVGRFREILERPAGINEHRQLGELMYQSHESYSACGLGSDGADLLVGMVIEAGCETGLYGAKITGGGSGGTVAVLGRRDAESAVKAIARKYTRATGRRSLVISGSSPGAGSFGHLKLIREKR
ncbi:MAG: GHMP kinase [Acidobacteriota bacterium]|nr:MAG: GHMP kinase [Acidobacteriota bacterium]